MWDCGTLLMNIAGMEIQTFVSKILHQSLITVWVTEMLSLKLMIALSVDNLIYQLLKAK